MSALNRQTFRPGQMDYSALAQEDLADLMPPDVRQEITGQFRDAGLEVTGSLEGPTEDDQARERGEREGAGSAVFDGAPKPVPGDELAAAVYHRDPDARSDIGLMVAAGYIAASGRDDDAPTPEPSQRREIDPMEGMEPRRGNYDALAQHQAASIENSGLGDLMPADARAEVAAAGYSPAGQEVGGRAASAEQDDMADLMPPDIRAEVAENSRQQSQQRVMGMGL